MACSQGDVARHLVTLVGNFVLLIQEVPTTASMMKGAARKITPTVIDVAWLIYRPFDLVRMARARASIATAASTHSMPR